MEDAMLNDALEAYIFANTPGYLYRKLYASGYVNHLMAMSSESLKNLIELASPEDSISIAKGYAAAMALFRKEIDIEQILQISENNSLDWLPFLANLYSQKATLTSVTAIKANLPKSHILTSSFEILTPVNIVKVGKND